MDLPTLLLITGPRGSGRSTLANSLSDHIPGGALAMSFLAPIYGACQGAFFDGSPDILPRSSILPGGTGETVESFYRDFESWFRLIYGTSILHDLAIENIRAAQGFFSHFIVEDLTLPHNLPDVRLFLKSFDNDALLINLADAPLQIAGNRASVLNYGGRVLSSAYSTISQDFFEAVEDLEKEPQNA